MDNNHKTIIIIPGYETSTIEIVVSPNSDKVLVMELFWYGGTFKYAGFNDEQNRLPSHMVNNVFEATAGVNALINSLKKLEFLDQEDDEFTPMRCIVHATHLLDEQPIVCMNFASALEVAKALANHNA